jgi:flagellar FliJ protein
MAKFRFALERVLDRRLKEEEARRLVLAKIEGHRRALEDALRDRQREIGAGRDDWRNSLVGTVDPVALRHNAAASMGLMRKAQRTVLELAGLDKSLVRAKADLVEAARARRALEILREQRFAAFKTVEARREREQLDEFAQEMTRRADIERRIAEEKVVQ